MGSQKTGIELLAPAKNLKCGRVAINHGADAVYIGGPGFGARKMAGNSLDDIRQLIDYAHLFKAKVYITLNTLLFDHELEEANTLIHNYYELGADAVIIQDMGLLETKLPPIAFHASTQTDNRDTEKVKFLEGVGFKQVVLARELSIDQIKAIHAQSNVRLEYFIHGALCVCYSGQCYMSSAINNRSANRGECGQPCRLKYSMKDNSGDVLYRDKHLLSLKDLNLSDHLEDLIDAGVTSFKIEGRLKDEDYVANVTMHYRQLLDEIIQRRSDLVKDSSGFIQSALAPKPEKSFNRGFTGYFVNGRQKDIWSIDTPKSLGEKIGKVVEVAKDHFIIQSSIPLKNGDGLCYFSKKKEMAGIGVNRVEGNKVFPNQMHHIYPGATLFRNYDIAFQNEIKKDQSHRKINVDISLTEEKHQFPIAMSDDDQVRTIYCDAHLTPSPATNTEVAFAQIKKQLSKLGNTVYHPRTVDINFNQDWFFPAAGLNGLRRQLVERHSENRIKQFHPTDKTFVPNNTPYPASELDFSGNVINDKAKQFYERHGVTQIDWGFEKSSKRPSNHVMTTKHCLLYMADKCLMHHPEYKSKLPISLYNDKDEYQLKFDCKRCEMQIWRKK
ncbi:MAG: U32 family peptidase [Marinilabiliaceae bacterium]|nr:U32 family peptidase [Marinilabiliaceae bacterium]